MTAWQHLADLLIQREVLTTRVRRDAPPDLMPGPIRGPEVDRIVESLILGKGADGIDETLDGKRARLEEIRAAFDGPLDDACTALDAELKEDTAFSILAANARLDPLGATFMGLACAIELEPAHQRLVGWLQDDPGSRRATLGLMARIQGDEALQVFGPDAALLRAGYITVDSDGPWASQQIIVEPAVMWTLIGDRSRDPDLPSDVQFHNTEEVGDPAARVVVVHGGERWRRLEAAADLAPNSRYLVTKPPTDDDGWRALVREATMRGCGVVLDVDGNLDTARHWIDRAEQVVWVVSSQSPLPLDQLPRRAWREIEAGCEPAGPEDWERFLPGADVGRHPLSSDQIRQVARAYEAGGGDLDAAVRRLASGDIDRLARRIRPRRTWDDLVVPDDRRTQLREVATRYRHRAIVHGEWGYDRSHSRGVIALFHGPSGTGKTLSAEIIANDLGLDLFKIDLSAMVSKYIGETEKNLEEVFNAASAANVVLLFDEADSLFGKRSEVNDAKDRYANIEVSYLLQRIEAYDGIAVLTTNLLKNIDNAFLRRIDVLAEFALPEYDERLALWRLGFPPEAPLGKGIDLEGLAEQFKLAGGNIHSVAVAAAYLAADEKGVISMDHVIEALGREYTKLGRLRSAEEFGPWLS